MKNFEFYEKEIKELNCRFGKKGSKLVDCNTTSCSICDFHWHRYCDTKKFKWLYEEYKEEPKLTKKEKAFSRIALGTHYIARDKNNELYIFDDRPSKGVNGWENDNLEINILKINEDFFPFIKWEDEEPWSIEELRKLEVEE